MTREEAKAYIIKHCIPNYPKMDKTEWDTAMGMAIEALSSSETPNSSDSISRQAAIEAIKEDKIDLTDPNVAAVFKATGDFEKAETQMMTCNRHIKILKDLPSAQSEITHCKDCKHWDKVLPDIGYCQIIRHDEAVWWIGDDFCSRAERREE